MRAVLAIYSICSIYLGGTVAAPKYPHVPVASTSPDVVAAERLWTEAAAVAEPARAAAAFARAAAAFVAIADDASRPERAAAARAAVAAWRNALEVAPHTAAIVVDKDPERVPMPRSIPERERRVVHAIELLRRLDPGAPATADAMFVQAGILRDHDHLDEAVAIYVEIVTAHPAHAVAEAAANLALDSLNRRHAYDELVALAERLRGNPTFLANKRELAATLARIHVQAMRRTAEQLERRARDAKDPELYVQCAKTYVAIYDAAPNDRHGDEVLYNAMVCFHAAGSLGAELAIASQLDRAYPRSRLRPRWIARTVTVYATTAQFDRAAEAAERLLRDYPGERDSLDAGQNALYWRIGIGDLTGAARTLNVLRRTYGTKRARDLLEGQLALIDAQLAAGQRLAATRRLQAIAGELARLDHFRAARIVADAACPIALVDELCTRPRDAKLVALAKRLLARAPRETRDRAARILLDLELESADPNALRGLADRYTELAKSSEPEIAVAALSRLAWIARAGHAPQEARLQAEACVARVRETKAGARWLAGCERVLGRAPDREHLFAPAISIVTAVESP